MTEPPFTVGRCHLCGGKSLVLTYEHIPAKTSFNQLPVEQFGLEHWLERGPDGEMQGGLPLPEGAGAKTLCSDCNNVKTGSWYVPEFKRWTHAGRDRLRQIRDEGPQYSLALDLQGVYPARFIKQVVAMLASVNSPTFLDDHPELRKLVLERDSTGFGKRYRVYLALTAPASSLKRHVGLTARFEAAGWLATWLTEVVWPPFVYVLTIDEPKPFLEKGDISHFADYSYESKVDLRLELAILLAALPFGGEYSGPDESASEHFPTRSSALVRAEFHFRNGERRAGDFSLPASVGAWRGPDLQILLSGMLGALGVSVGEAYSLKATWSPDSTRLDVSAEQGVVSLEPRGVPLVAVEDLIGRTLPTEGSVDYVGRLQGPAS